LSTTIHFLKFDEKNNNNNNNKYLRSGAIKVVMVSIIYGEIHNRFCFGGFDRNATQIGPWIITAQLYNNLKAEEIQLYLEQKAFTSMEAFMEGVFEYWLEVPKASVSEGEDHETKEQSQVLPPLTFTTFVKRTRPKAWKGIDPKIQDSLPLLGYIAPDDFNRTMDNRKVTCGNDEPDTSLAPKYYAKVTMCLTMTTITNER
jgi:hypothetical protein